MKTVATFLLTLLAFNSFSQTRLELDLKKGESYRQTTQNNAKVTQTIMGQPLEITLGVHSTMSFMVEGSNSNSYDMKVTFESMKLSMGSLQGIGFRA